MNSQIYTFWLYFNPLQLLLLMLKLSHLWTVGVLSGASVLKPPISFSSILDILILGQMFQAHLVHVLPQT